MAGLEALEPEHAEFAAGEMVERGAAHRSKPDHDCIVIQDSLSMPNPDRLTQPDVPNPKFA